MPSASLPSDLVGGIIKIYRAQRPTGALSFRGPASFVALFPDELGDEAYLFFVKCISPIMTSSSSGSVSGQVSLAQIITLTCHAEEDLSGQITRSEIVVPLDCPPEVDQGFDFTISASFVCGSVSRQRILTDEHGLATAVGFTMVQSCLRRDDDPEAASHCTRPDDKNYKAVHSCFIVSFHTRH